MSKTLTITDEKVKKAATSCPTAKGVLREMFPEVFADEWVEVPAKDIEPFTDAHRASFAGRGNTSCFDIHFKYRPTGDWIGYISFRDGEPSFMIAESNFKAEVAVMSDQAIVFKVFKRSGHCG